MTQERLLQLEIEGRQLISDILEPAPDPMGMMKLYRPMNLSSRQYGKFKITSEAATCFDVTTSKQAFLFGVEPIRLNYGSPIEFHQLMGEESGNGFLTSDRPFEIYSQYIAFRKMKGRVLVGGLGLGMAANMIAKLPKVDSVTVIEKESDIVHLVEGSLHRKVRVIESDLFEFLRNMGPGRAFDSAYYDIWYSTDAIGCANHIVPLYRLSRKRGIKVLGAWGEHEMFSQIIPALYLRSRSLSDRDWTWKPYKVFREGLKKKLGGHPPYSARYKSTIVKLIRLYLCRIGTREWERTFPWDALPDEP